MIQFLVYSNSTFQHTGAQNYAHFTFFSQGSHAWFIPVQHQVINKLNSLLFIITKLALHWDEQACVLYIFHYVVHPSALPSHKLNSLLIFFV